MKVNEIFYSLQGEGYNTGTAAIFVRFAGCNLRCAFCDTNHKPFMELSEGEIVQAVSQYPASLVVFTGGEPTLQLTESLIKEVHKLGKVVAVETNGTRQMPKGVDWVTVSPKQPFVGDTGALVLKKANEVKLVFDGTHTPKPFIAAEHYYLQPCDTGNNAQNQEIIKQAVEYIKHNPIWKLSIQTQKILGVR